MNTLKEKLIENGQKNEILILHFLYKFKYTTPFIVGQWLNITNYGTTKFIKRMEDRGLIKSFVFKKSILVKKIIGITWHGLATLASNKLNTAQTEEEKQKVEIIQSAKEFEISKFRETQYYHQMAIQKFVIDFKQGNKKYNLNHVKKIFNIETDREIRLKFLNQKKKNAKKYPDLVLHATLNNGEETKIAVELELTAKSKIRYQEIVKNHHNYMVNKAYDSVLYVIPKNIKSIQNNILFFANKFSDANRFIFAEFIE